MISITIKSSGDTKYEVSIEESQTVRELKEAVAQQAGVEADRQRLIYSGKVLKDGETVGSYKVQSGHTIHLVKSAAKAGGNGGNSANGASNSTSSTNAGGNGSTDGATAGSNTASNSAVPSNIAAGTGAFNPLADLTGARYAGYTQLPSASMFGPDGGMNGSMPDPEQMSEMMSNPMFQESMNNLLSNPQMLDYLIAQSPQLRAMGPQAREMLQSPFFRQMLSNPEMMRGMMQMQGMAGMGGSGGFPAPGGAGTESNESGANSGTNSGTNSAGTGTNSGTNSGANAVPNPFASLGFLPPMPSAAPADNRPPEEVYANQLSQLNDMGFFDFDRNVQALRRSGGNVQGAIEFLLSE